jgi:hypothetical protein
MRRNQELKIWISMLFTLVIIARQDAQDLSLSLISEHQTFSSRNVANPYPKRNNIILPELSARIFNESGALDDWIGNTGSGTRTVGLQDIWKSLDRKDYVSGIDWNAQTIGFGKRYDRFQIMISHRIHGNFDFLYNKDLVGLIAFGNYGLLQAEPMAKTQALDLRPASDIFVFQSIGADGAYFLNEHHSIGGGIHYLSGWYDFKSDVKKFDLDIRDPLTIKANEDWTVRTANLVDHLAADSVKINVDEAAWGTHPGMSINLGYSFHTEHLQIGAQIRDLGMIKWQGTSYSRKAITDYSGLRINDILNIDKSIFDHISDTLKALTAVQQSGQSYTTRLHSAFILDGQYKINPHWSLGGSFMYKSGSIKNYWQGMLGAVFSPVDFFQLGVHTSYDQYHNADLGLMSALSISIVHIYLNLSPFPSAWNTSGTNRLSGTFGMSVQWGK